MEKFPRSCGSGGSYAVTITYYEVKYEKKNITARKYIPDQFTKQIQDIYTIDKQHPIRLALEIRPSLSVPSDRSRYII